MNWEGSGSGPGADMVGAKKIKHMHLRPVWDLKSFEIKVGGKEPVGQKLLTAEPY
jgi:hypothetical protein